MALPRRDERDEKARDEHPNVGKEPPAPPTWGSEGGAGQRGGPTARGGPERHEQDGSEKADER